MYAANETSTDWNSLVQNTYTIGRLVIVDYMLSQLIRSLVIAGPKIVRDFMSSFRNRSSSSDYDSYGPSTHSLHNSYGPSTHSLHSLDSKHATLRCNNCEGYAILPSKDKKMIDNYMASEKCYKCGTTSWRRTD